MEVNDWSHDCLALPSGWAGSYTCPALRPYQFGPMRVPKCNHKVTDNGYKAVVGCKAKTSTKALITCSKCFHRFGQLLVRSYPPDCRNLLGHRSKAPPPRQGGWPRWRTSHSFRKHLCSAMCCKLIGGSTVSVSSDELDHSHLSSCLIILHLCLCVLSNWITNI